MKEKIKTRPERLLLEALKLGIARFEPSTGEFCFQGLRYQGRYSNWSGIVAMIGREKIEAAIAVSGPQ